MFAFLIEKKEVYKVSCFTFTSHTIYFLSGHEKNKQHERQKQHEKYVTSASRAACASRAAFNNQLSNSYQWHLRINRMSNFCEKLLMIAMVLLKLLLQKNLNWTSEDDSSCESG